MVVAIDTVPSPRVEETTIKQRSSASTTAGKNYTGWRSRGWTSLKYPQSSVFPANRGGDHQARLDRNMNLYFPLHQDVLLAAVRELLILDGTLHGTTLKVSEEVVKFHHNGSSVPKYLQHLDLVQWRAFKAAHLALKTTSKVTANKSTRKRKNLCRGTINNQVKRSKRDEIVPDLVKNNSASDESVGEGDTNFLFKQLEGRDEEARHHPSAEDIAHSIVLRARMVVFADSDAISKCEERSRAESNSGKDIEAPIEPSGAAGVDRHPVAREGYRDISNFLSLSERTPDGSIRIQVSAKSMPSMVQTSISSEAILRDAAMTMTTRLVESFSDTSLRLFLGYKKTPAVVGRDRLIRLLAAFLFDASHAMFAWDQTEEELLSSPGENSNDERDIDSVIQKSLFDERALRTIGGFEPSSLLPHAISIARLRRRRLIDSKKSNLNSWEFFATTAQGSRMLSHHRGLGGGGSSGCKSSSSVINVGKQRRGQRLRQRHWLTSTLLWNESSECDASISSSSSCPGGARSRTSSIASYEEEAFPGVPSMLHHQLCGVEFQSPTRHQSRILTEMPGTLAVTMTKEAIGSSWGVLLAKEGDMCVVARASSKVKQTSSTSGDKDNALLCGDLILHAENERANEATTPLCVASHHDGQFREDWFRKMVDLFKGSQRLHLIIQRVGAASN